MDQAPQLVGFTLQQGVAVALALFVAALFAWAIVKLFQKSAEERATAAAALEKANNAGAAALDKAHADARDERREFLAQLDRHTTALDANTRATERLTDRLSPAARAA